MSVTQEKGTYYIAKKVMPNGEKQSAVLPSDQWMLKNTWQSLKSTTGFKSHALKIVGGIGLGILSLAAAATSAVLITSVNIAIGVSIAAVAGTAICGHVAAKAIKSFKQKILPPVKKDMGNRLMKFKASQFLGKWKDNVQSAQNKQDAQAPKAEENKPSTTPESKLGKVKGLFQKAFTKESAKKAEGNLTQKPITNVKKNVPKQ